MTPIKKFWQTDRPKMQFPVKNLGSLVELLRGYIGVMTAPYDILITSPRNQKWKIPKGAALERKSCVLIPEQKDEKV